MWYLMKGVLLTKDNLAKRKWKGNMSCAFCSCNENIQHLFFDCHLSRAIWNAISIAFGVRKPENVNDLLGAWVKGWSKENRKQIVVGISALCWAIWLSRNDICFKGKSSYSFLQVIFRGTYWARMWAKLSKEEEEDRLKRICNVVERTMLEIFNNFGWKTRYRLQG